MRAKGIHTIVAMMFIIVISSCLFADTIIDSVYSTPELTGDIFFSQQYQTYSVSVYNYCMTAGDTGLSVWPFNDPNSITRSYVSFPLPDIPQDYYIDSCYVMLGNSSNKER